MSRFSNQKSSITLHLNMAGRSIKLFQFNQKYCKTIGIQLPETNRKGCKYNWINLGFFICSIEFFITSSAYLLYDANSMAEYGIVFFVLTTVIECMVAYLISILKVKEISEFIENCEDFIEKSK